MKLLVVGSGGREHAIIKKLWESPKVSEIYAAPGNGGIAADARCVDIQATDPEGMTAFVKQRAIDFVVVAPDDPLALGMVDALAAIGVPAFGPDQKAAAIEASKVFSKGLMKKYAIPTAAYESFDRLDAAVAYLDAQNSYPTVIKADGLALGKGVVIAPDRARAVDALRSMLEEGAFGDSGRRVVIEEFLEGVEVSVLSFTDGQTVLPMVSSMDHKRALDGDRGLNTGGMGTIAPHPLYTPEVAARCMREIYRPTVEAMKAEGRPFKGCLYFGLMLTTDGPKVIEYNCRFGDPETQVVLPLLETDLLEIMLATAEGRLDCCDVRWKPDCAACVILASGGYPAAYRKGLPIHGLDARGRAGGVTVYHAGTRLDAEGNYLTAGGRVLGLTAVGPTLQDALASCYAAVERVGFAGGFCRRDIGAKVL